MAASLFLRTSSYPAPSPHSMQAPFSPPLFLLRSLLLFLPEREQKGGDATPWTPPPTPNPDRRLPHPQVCLPPPPALNTVAMDRIVALLFVAATWAAASPASGCNKALCASDVSKCLLQEVCQCEANRAGCPCCQECAFCLDHLWESCCECVGLCDERLPSAPRPAQRSSMHNLMSPVPSLFRALMAISDNDPPMGWSILTLPIEQELQQNHAETGHLLLGPHTGLTLPDAEGLNATAPPCQSIFFNECLSMSRCRTACQSVGAWRYRWFHNACCQCLGPDCLGYGGAQARCSSCRD